MSDEKPEVKPEASPTGQPTGPSALWNALPVPVQSAVVVVVFLATILSPVIVAQPDAFPVWAKVLIVSLAGLGGPIGMVSTGVRK